MKNFILNALLLSFFALSFSTKTNAQDSVASSTSSSTRTTTSTEINDKGAIKKLIITESETDKSYRMSCRFNKEKTAEIRSYLSGLLGEFDREVGTVRQVWKHLPDGEILDGLDITLRDGQFSIKAKDNCCPGDMEELKDIAEDIKSMLGSDELK